MGKKQKDVLDKMKSKFMDGCKANGHDEKVCEKIWKDWEAFASYAFNKSHSTCYAFVAFQTAYLKTHYSAEYMSAVLTHNLSNIDKITFFMEECRRMGIPVLGPDVNESQYNFAVNKKGEIRFGLGAIKGVGESAVESLIEERTTNGAFKNIFDLTQRISGKAANKRCLESLAQAGAFDCFAGIHRAQYFATDGKDNVTAIERAVKYGSAYTNQLNSSQHSLFGDSGSATEIPAPVLTACEPWSKLEELKKEKEVIGFYISGHPLDGFRFEIKNFCNINIADLNQDLEKQKNKEVCFAGIITEVNHRMSKTGKPFGNFNIEDFHSKMQITLFGEDYGKLKQFLNIESIVYIKAKVSPRYYNPDELELKVSTIQFLSDVCDKMTKQLNVKMKLYDVNRSNISKLQGLLDVNKGTVPVRMQIVDEEKNWSVPLVSKVHRVKVNSQLVDEMKDVMNLEVSIN